MWKPPKNTQAIELTKSYTDRQFAISGLKHVTREDGSKGCVWCGDPLKTKHHAQRYCKDKRCAPSAHVWGYPQSTEGLNILLIKQNFCCNSCGYDYKPFLETVIIGKFYGTGSAWGKYLTESNYYVTKRLKERIDPSRKPEVDHIVPIYKGGQALGLDNHQAICYLCHKAKTKTDLSGKRKVNI